MNTLVSICIPTFNRPALLHQAVESCLRQTHRDIEIIICDDSPNCSTEEMIQGLGRTSLIRYHHNIPALRQPGNVNRLFDLARGDYLVLLHDDDILLPDAVENLLQCCRENPDITAAFGKHYIINMDGEIMAAESEALNAYYCRTATHAGRQTSAVWSALVGQFPNDGFMIRSDAARQIRYRDVPEVGDYCDFDFGLRLGQAYEGFFFLDRYAAKYRLTETSISKSNYRADLSYHLIESLPLPNDLEPVRARRMESLASPAINSLVARGAKREAWRVFISPTHPWSKRLSPRGICQIVLMACPTRLSAPLLALIRRVLSEG